jgi:hypothetical protein
VQAVERKKIKRGEGGEITIKGERKKLDLM